MDALAEAGRTPVNLPFLDRQYRRPWQAPSLKDLDDRLAGGGAAGTRRVRPRRPRVCRRSRTTLSCGAWRWATARSGIQVWLYADVPYATTFGWPHWVSETPDEPRPDVDAYWQRLAEEVPGIGGIREARVVRART